LTLGCDRDGEPLGDGGGGGGGGGAADMSIPRACVGLECQIKRDCAGGAHTTLTGKVYAPNGTLALYNATVFIPNGPLEPFTPGVTCDRCDGKLSGDPLVQAQSSSSGEFTLVDVPSGTNIPLVVQLGRWRRMVLLPKVEECVTTSLTMADARLPRNKNEGDIPQIAMVTGSADPFECLLRKLGIDDGEVTIPSGMGRVHFYRENGRQIAGTPAPQASTLWENPAALAQYNMVILACEGNPNAHPTGFQNLINYLDAGGRVFATHFSYAWLTYNTPMESPYNVVGMPWHPRTRDPPDPLTGTIDRSFPKGLAFAEWLQSVEPTGTLGTLAIKESRHDLDLVNPMYGQAWITATSDHLITQHMTFNTPLDPAKDAMGNPLYCGRVVFSDFHVSAGALEPGQTTYPLQCKIPPVQDLSAQEKALAFMLFDLSSCVQKDTEPPIP
jgi:hypothetical protein